MQRAYELVDPRPSAAASPYTYFLPLTSRLEAIMPNDLVQLVFRAIPASEKWDAERIWVRVRAVGAHVVEGDLDSTPDDMPGVERGMSVRFERFHIIGVVFNDPAIEKTIPEDLRRKYWERCLVDRCVVYEGVPVHYLYREEPDMGEEGDKYPDSGWRIRGDMRNLSDEELERRELSYVALGAVLNEDDSWLHLIDEPVGSAFEREFQTGAYVPSK